MTFWGKLPVTKKASVLDIHLPVESCHNNNIISPVANMVSLFNLLSHSHLTLH